MNEQLRTQAETALADAAYFQGDAPATQTPSPLSPDALQAMRVAE